MDPPYRLSPVSTNSKSTLGMLHSPTVSPHTLIHMDVDNTEPLDVIMIVRLNASKYENYID